MVKSFTELVVPLATCSLMLCCLQNNHFQNWKGRAVELGCDSTNNIMADKQMFAYKRRTVFLKGRGLFPPWIRKKKVVGIKMYVYFGCIIGQGWHYTLQEGIWCCGKQGEYSMVMRLKSVANVSIKPLGKFHRQHSNVSPEVYKNKVFKPVIRRAQSYAVLGPHPWLWVGSNRLPPGVSSCCNKDRLIECLTLTSAILISICFTKK